MLFDTHSHIKPWSHDASQTIDQLIDDANDKGIAGICLTDHYEKDMYYERGYEDIFDPDDFFSALSPLRLSPAEAARIGKPAFLIGAELGWLPHLCNHLLWLTRSYPFDSIILSMHVFNNRDPYIDNTFYNQGLGKVYSQAIGAMLDMVSSFTDYDILGHYDYISRYYQGEQAKILYAHAPDEFDALLRKIALDGKCLEINTRTTVRLRKMGYSYNDSFPDSAIIARFLEFGGKYISLGSDSHHYGDAALIFSEMRDWLKSNGVNKLTYYYDRNPIQYNI